VCFEALALDAALLSLRRATAATGACAALQLDSADSSWAWRCGAWAAVTAVRGEVGAAEGVSLKQQRKLIEGLLAYFKVLRKTKGWKETRAESEGGCALAAAETIAGHKETN